MLYFRVSVARRGRRGKLPKKEISYCSCCCCCWKERIGIVCTTETSREGTGAMDPVTIQHCRAHDPGLTHTNGQYDGPSVRFNTTRPCAKPFTSHIRTGKYDKGRLEAWEPLMGLVPLPIDSSPVLGPCPCLPPLLLLFPGSAKTLRYIANAQTRVPYYPSFLSLPRLPLCLVSDFGLLVYSGNDTGRRARRKSFTWRQILRLL